MLKNIELNDRVKLYFEGRGISEDTLQKFFIHGKEEWMPQSQKKERCIVFPYIRDNEIVNAKYRDGKKGFKLVKDAELIFFGMQTLQGRRCAIIVEGEIDALSAYEVGFGQDYEPIATRTGKLWSTILVDLRFYRFQTGQVRETNGWSIWTTALSIWKRLKSSSSQPTTMRPVKPFGTS